MTETLIAVSFPALGTTATVVVAGEEQATSAALDAVRAEVAAIDQACSRFRADSELCEVNRSAGRPVPVGALLMEAVVVALRAARLTGGLVDPTIGRSLRHLGYDRDFASVPAGTGHPDLTSRALHRAGWGQAGARSSRPVLTLLASAAPGWRVVSLDRARGTISVPVGVELDLGATAKALASDRAARAAAQASQRGVLVSMGGDVAVAGPPPGGGWSIRVTDDHRAGPDAPGQTVTVAAGGLATSGTTVRRWRHAGVEVHHLIDPATGQPAAETWATVSVAAGSCVDANTASTAAVILGAAAPDWLASQDLPARLVARDGTVTTVSGWPDQQP